MIKSSGIFILWKSDYLLVFITFLVNLISAVVFFLIFFLIWNRFICIFDDKYTDHFNRWESNVVISSFNSINNYWYSISLWYRLWRLKLIFTIITTVTLSLKEFIQKKIKFHLRINKTKQIYCLDLPIKLVILSQIKHVGRQRTK